MEVYKLKVDGSGQTLILKTASEIAGEIKEGSAGDIFTVEVLEMAPEKFNTLPEFQGF